MLPIHTPGGIGRYTRILGAILLTKYEDELFLFLQKPSDLDFILSELPEEERKSFRLKPTTHLIYSNYPNVLRFLLNQWEIPLRFKELPLDIYLDADIILPPLRGPKTLIVVHDTTPFNKPHLLGLKARIIYTLVGRKSLTNTSGIICVSEYTKHQLVKLFPGFSHKTKVLNSCLSPKFYAWSSTSYQYYEEITVQTEHGGVLVRCPFILFVGREGQRKNISTLVEAFMQLRQKGYKHSLVMVGGKAEKPAMLKASLTPYAVPTGTNLELPSSSPPIIRLGRVTDEDLVQLYRHADLVALISLEEGFGYPALEAIAFRTPALVPEVSPMSEFDERCLVKVSNTMDAQLVAQKMEEVLRRAGEFSLGAWTSSNREKYSPERYFKDLMEILCENS